MPPFPLQLSQIPPTWSPPTFMIFFLDNSLSPTSAVHICGILCVMENLPVAALKKRMIFFLPLAAISCQYLLIKG